MDEELAKNKRRMLGNIKFIGELFKLKVCLWLSNEFCSTLIINWRDDEIWIFFLLKGKGMKSYNLNLMPDSC